MIHSLWDDVIHDFQSSFFLAVIHDSRFRFHPPIEVFKHGWHFMSRLTVEYQI